VGLLGGGGEDKKYEYREERAEGQRRRSPVASQVMETQHHQDLTRVGYVVEESQSTDQDEPEEGGMLPNKL